MCLREMWVTPIFLIPVQKQIGPLKQMHGGLCQGAITADGKTFCLTHPNAHAQILAGMA